LNSNRQECHLDIFAASCAQKDGCSIPDRPLDSSIHCPDSLRAWVLGRQAGGPREKKQDKGPPFVYVLSLWGFSSPKVRAKLSFETDRRRLYANKFDRLRQSWNACGPRRSTPEENNASVAAPHAATWVSNAAHPLFCAGLDRQRRYWCDKAVLYSDRDPPIGFGRWPKAPINRHVAVFESCRIDGWKPQSYL